MNYRFRQLVVWTLLNKVTSENHNFKQFLLEDVQNAAEERIKGKKTGKKWMNWSSYHIEN